MNWILIFTLLVQSLPFPGPGGIVPSAGTEFVTSTSGTTDRNNFTGRLGYFFTPSQNLTVVKLGRLCRSGNSLSHTVYLSDPTPTYIASVSVNMSGCTAGTWVYGSVSASLTSGTTYRITVQETNADGDNWLDNILNTLTTTSVASVGGSTYSTDNGATYNDSAGVIVYDSPNFQYQ